MSNALKVGLALLVATLYFFGSHYYGARSGESLSLTGQHRNFILREKEPERFAENQRKLRLWGFGFLGVGAIVTVYGLVQHRREKLHEASLHR